MSAQAIVATISTDAGPVVLRQIPSWDAYAAGDDGNIWSRRRAGNGTNRGSWHKLKPGRSVHGRPIVGLSIGSGPKTKAVGPLVLQAWVGPRPVGYQCCHFPNRDPWDNRPSNLLWGSAKQNAEHRRVQGTHICGEKVCNSKLYEIDVRNVLAFEEWGVPRALNAKLFGVDVSLIGLICRRQIWRHVTASS